MNHELFNKIKKELHKEKHFDFSMDHWHCGTSACIAGFAAVLHYRGGDFSHGRSPYKVPELDHPVGISSAAEHALDIPEWLAVRLFYYSGWPKEAMDEYEKTKTQEERCNIAIQVIDHYQKVFPEVTLKTPQPPDVRHYLDGGFQLQPLS